MVQSLLRALFAMKEHKHVDGSVSDFSLYTEVVIAQNQRLQNVVFLIIQYIFQCIVTFV